jgi:hypothetical protein
MISGDVIPEQARLMRGDLYSHMQDEANAVESYSSLLASPQFAREARREWFRSCTNRGEPKRPRIWPRNSPWFAADRSRETAVAGKAISTTL